MKARRLRSNLPICFFIAISGFAAIPASARPLDKHECNLLSSELDKLTKEDVPEAIVKGPVWTLAHMPPETVGRVRHYLVVEERLRFRCRGKKPPALDPEDAKASITAINKKPQSGAGGAERKATSAPVPGKSRTRKSEGSAQAGDVSGGVPLPARKPEKTVRRAMPRKQSKTKGKKRESVLETANGQFFP